MNEETRFETELFFAALADRTRLRLLNLMRDGEVCVCFFADTLGTNNPKISRHLSFLKRAGLVTGRRDGKWMYYQLSEPKSKAVAEILARIMTMLSDNQEMEADRLNLVNVCCTRGPLVGIERKRPA